MKRSILMICGLAAIAAVPAAAAPAAKPVVVEIKNAAGQNVGTATLTDAGPGVRIKLDIKSLPAGEHSIHIHQMAKCEPPDFKSAGAHFFRMPGGQDPTGGPAGDKTNFLLVVWTD